LFKASHSIWIMFNLLIETIGIHSKKFDRSLSRRISRVWWTIK